MSINPTGAISVNDIKDVFELDPPVSFAAFYALINGPPLLGSAISMSDVQGKSITPIVKPKWLARIVASTEARVTCVNMMSNGNVHATGYHAGPNGNTTPPGTVLQFFNADGSLFRSITTVTAGSFNCVLSPDGVFLWTGYTINHSGLISSTDVTSSVNADDEIFLAITIGTGISGDPMVFSDPSTGVAAIQRNVGGNSRTLFVKYASNGACTMVQSGTNIATKVPAVTTISSNRSVFCISCHTITLAGGSFYIRSPAGELRTFTDNIGDNGSPNLFLACFNAAGFWDWDARITSLAKDEVTNMFSNSTSDGFLVTLSCDAITTGPTVTSSDASTVTLPASTDAGTTDFDAYVVLMNTSGMFQWSIHIKGASANDNTLSACMGTVNAKAYACGLHGGNASFKHSSESTFKTVASAGPWVMCASLTGTIEWVAHASGTTTNRANSICELKNGDLMVSGQVTTTMTFYHADGSAGPTINVTGGVAVYLARYSPTGVVLWATTIRPSASSMQVRSITADNQKRNAFYAGGGFQAGITAYDQNGQATSVSAALTSTQDAYVCKYGY